MAQQKNNMTQIKELESALNQKLVALTRDGASPSSYARENALIDICEERDLSLTVCSETIAYIHEDEGEFCLRVEFKHGADNDDALLLKPFPLNKEMHEALSLIQPTRRKL